MSLRISGSKNEFRETYLPVLKKRLIAPLATEGSVSWPSSSSSPFVLRKKQKQKLFVCLRLRQDGIAEAIEAMEYYYLSREDFDNILEITHTFSKEGDLWKGVNPQVKAAFTRKFNQMVHIVPYSEGAVTKGRAKAAPTATPDLEEADREGFEDAEEDKDGEQEGGEEDESVEKDKMIKVKKTTASTSKKASGSGKGSGSGSSGNGGGRSRK